MRTGSPSLWTPLDDNTEDRAVKGDSVPASSTPGTVESAERIFSVIVRASARYRNSQRLDYVRHRIECTIQDKWNRIFPCFLDYDPYEQHLVSLVVRLASELNLKCPKVLPQLAKTGSRYRLAHIDITEDGHVFVKAFATDVQHAETIPVVVQLVFSETLGLVSDEMLRTALSTGGAILAGEPERPW